MTKNGEFTRRSLLGAAGGAAMVALGVARSARAADKVTRVHFEAGNDNTSVKGKVTGHDYHDYVLGARAGQRMGVSLITKGTCYFNIEAPGSDGAAIYNGSMDGPDAVNIKLPKDGDYTIRVYLMGNDRDSDATVHYQLSMTIM